MTEPESASSFHARLAAAADSEGRLPVGVEAMPGWDIFPYELTGLLMKPLRPALTTEQPRAGDDPGTCACVQDRGDERLVWSNERWRLTHANSSGPPLLLLLGPVRHHDLNDLPDDLAAEMGQLMVAIADAMEGLPSIGRAHIQKIGDGGAHLHLWFMGRPALTDQFLGSPLVDWEESFPRVPTEVLRANAAALADELVAGVGGHIGPYAAVGQAY